MLYIFDEIDALDDGFPERACCFLSAQRHEKVFSYRFPLDKKLSATVYLLLRLILKESYGIDEPVVFSYDKNGKPSLCGYPQIHFNLSHCRSAAACAVSDVEVGVDVQEITPISDELAHRALTAREFAKVKSSPRPDELFCDYWTIKESWLKKTGQGVSVDLTALSADSIGANTLFKRKDYYCCVTGIHEVRNIDYDSIIS